jgi:creatinine amidohydrolase
MHEALKITAHQFKAGNYDKAILALGSCEAHGQHLPLGTDTHVSYMLACKVAEQVPGLLVLPPVSVGVSEHYARFPFTIYLKYDTMIAVIKDILRTTIANGIKKIFLMNGHDGNIAAIEVAAREIKMECPDARIVALNDWWVAAGKLLPPAPLRCGTAWATPGRAKPPSPSRCLSSGAKWTRPPASCRTTCPPLWTSNGTLRSSPTLPPPATPPRARRPRREDGKGADGPRGGTLRRWTRRTGTIRPPLRSKSCERRPSRGAG